MSAAFKHPLARVAKVWQTGGANGQSSRVLVVVTTLELDPAHKGFKSDNVERLTSAAKEWIGQNSAVAGDFMLVSRPRDWESAQS